MSDRSAALPCDVFRSPRREGTYLFVSREDGLSRVPEALLENFGEPERFLSIMLHPTRHLAQADPQRVLDAIGETGYYLQMPPGSLEPC